MAIVNISTLSSITSAGTCTQTTAAITTTSSTALAANPNRKKALLLNPPSSTTTVFLSFTSTATAVSGIPLAPGQGWAEESNIVYTGIFTAITAAGSGSLLCFEWA